MRIAVVVSLAAALCVPGHLPAQSLRGAVGGRVLDSTGKAMPGAVVKVLSLETNRQRETVTTPVGDFLLSLLPPGAYRLTVEKSGFETNTREIQIEVNQQQDLSIVLPVAGQRQSLNVSAHTSLLRTESVAAGGVVTTQQILDLPLNGRNYYDLSLLLPGVAPAAQGAAGAVRGSFSVTVNGARDDANSFLLDGVYNGDPKLNGVGLTSPVDAIREFEVGTSTHDASFGRNAGAQVNVVLRSGANQVRGTAWEFLRNDKMDARNFFAPYGQRDPQYQRNQFGAALGGPVVKDRTFWFADFESRITREGTPRVTNVPTALERVGDWSQSPGVPYVIDPYTQAPFAGNRIPVSRQDPIGRAIAALYPQPNRAVQGANYVAAPAARDNHHGFDVKLDHSFSQRSELSARYSYADRDLFEPYGAPGYSDVPGYGNRSPRRAQNAMVSETHVFTPTLLNEVRLAFSRTAMNVVQENQSVNLNQKVGLPTPWSNPRDNGLTFMTVRGFSSLGEEYNNPQRGVTNTYQLSEMMTWTRGRTTLKFGGEVRRMQQNAFRDVQSRGLINFTGFTGNALAEVLMGMPTVSGLAILDNPQYLRSQSYGLFAHATHRVTPDLTLVAGLRYEYNTPAVDKYDRANLYDPSTGQLTAVGTNGMPRSGYHADRNNFGPRFGFSYAPRGGATVLRGGYGIYYDQSSLAPGEGLYFNAPYFDFRLYVTSAQLPLTLQMPFLTFLPSFLPPSGFTFQRDLRTPYVQEWNFHVQRQLNASRVVEIGYVGSKGTHLYGARDINQPAPSMVYPNLRPNPRFDDINRLESRGNSNYHSLQASFTQRLSRGVSVLAAYTYGKSIDYGSGFFTSAGDPNFPMDSNHASLERARSGFDIRQRLSFSYSWLLPGPRTGLAGRLIGGWQTNGIWQFQTGRPFTVSLPSDQDNSNTGRTSLGFGANDRPNLVGTARLSDPTPAQWFNTAAFAVPQFGTFGNAGRNILDGPGMAVVNLSLMKTITLAERAKLQFRAEAFNAFNRANFDLPQAFLGGAGFGSIFSAQSPRQMQLGLKLLF